MERKLKILYLAAEVTPFAKTGGLADVAGSLPKALKALGHDIRVAMPRYGRISIEKFGLELILENVQTPMDEQNEPVRIFQGTLGKDVPVYFVDNARYFDRESIYMYPDDAERFTLFSRAALEMLRPLGFKPDIIHCNDWHTALIPNWLKTVYSGDPFYADIATVYTIHNLAYQGIFGLRVLEIAGLDEYRFFYRTDMADLDKVVNFMALGIYFADVVNTVSPRYAQEILTPEYGERLDPLLRERRDRLFGILNGIDYETLNPATDPYIAVNYDADSLDRRVQNKLALQGEASLPRDPHIPLIGMVSRLTDQKGLDILVEILDHLFDNFRVQFVLLGTGEQHYHDLLMGLAKRYPQNMGLFLTFNAPLAQRIYAGSDMFLMPSRFEPCGLSQMIAMRYGSAPIVRATGGLADTVKDYDPVTGEGTGFVFERYDRWALFGAIVRALERYKNPQEWRRIQLQGMKADFSWEASAKKYEELYYKALAFKKEEKGSVS